MTFDLFAEIEKTETQSVTQADIEVISKLAEKQKLLESTDFTSEEVTKFYNMLKNRPLALINEVAKKVKEDLDRIKGDYLPEAMDNVGMESFTLKGGGKVEVQKGLAVNLVNANKKAFYDWMIRKGWQDLIKNKVEVQFPMEGRQSSRRFVKYLERYYAKKGTCVFVEKEEVHSQTLKKLVKEQLEKGTKFPAELINIHEYKTTKIT